MLKFINPKKIIANTLLAGMIMSGSLVIPSSENEVQATSPDPASQPSGTVAPTSFSEDARVAKTVELERIVTLNLDELVETEVVKTGNFVKPEKLDVLFLADNTGSMGAAIANVKEHAKDLLDKIEAEYTDVEFGVAYYRRDPQEWSSRTYNKKVGTTKETIEVTVQDTKKVVVDTVACTKTWKYIKVDPNKTDKPYRYRIRTTDLSGKKLKDQYIWSNDSDLHGNEKSCTFDITKKVPVGEPYTVTKTKNKNIYEAIPREYLSYKLLEAVDGGTNDNTVAAINKWKAIDTGDWPEAGFFGLHQAATSGAPTPLDESNPGDSKNPDYPGAKVYSTGYNYMLQGTAESYDPADYNEQFNTKWREDSDMKLIVMFGDAKSHEKTITQAETIQALQDNNITVIMINVDTITGDEAKETELGLTVANDGLNGDGQASDIVTATSGKYSEVDNDVLVELLNGPPVDYSDEYCSSLAELDLVCTILSSVGEAAVIEEVITTYSKPKIDINFNTINFNPINSKTAEALALSIGPFAEDGQCIGYDTCVKYECIDPLGCTQVGNGEERKFKMTFQGHMPAGYNFDTVVVDASGNQVNGTISSNDITIHNID